MTKVRQLFLGLNEEASAHLEALLAREVCPQHIDTTLDGGSCAMCDLDHAQHAAAVSERWAKPSHQPEWVRRANASILPTKVIQ